MVSDRNKTNFHARILRGKGVQKKKLNMFIVGSSASTAFVLPVRHGKGVGKHELAESDTSLKRPLASGAGNATVK
eukprot:s620_g16.t1